MIISEEDFSFIDENVEQWDILVVDDDEGVLSVTEFILEDIEVAGKPVELHYARSAGEAVEFLQNNPDVSVMLLDVVMESTHSGLELVEKIRDELKNQNVRILLRTGQPGQAPESEVVQKYDIDDYLSKAELSETRLITSVTSAIRSYARIIHLAHLIKQSKQTIKTQQEGIKEINSFLEDGVSSCSSLTASRLLEVVSDKLPSLEDKFEIQGDRSFLDEEVLFVIYLIGESLEKLDLLTSKTVEFNEDGVLFTSKVTKSDLELLMEEGSDLGFLLALLKEQSQSEVTTDGEKLHITFKSI